MEFLWVLNNISGTKVPKHDKYVNICRESCGQWKSCWYEINCAEEHLCLLFIVISGGQRVDTSKNTDSFSTVLKVSFLFCFMCITLVFTLKCTIIFHLFVLQDGYKDAMLVPAAASHVYQQSQDCAKISKNGYKDLTGQMCQLRNRDNFCYFYFSYSRTPSGPQLTVSRATTCPNWGSFAFN